MKKKIIKQNYCDNKWYTIKMNFVSILLSQNCEQMAYTNNKKKRWQNEKGERTLVRNIYAMY